MLSPFLSFFVRICTKIIAAGKLIVKVLCINLLFHYNYNIIIMITSKERERAREKHKENEKKVIAFQIDKYTRFSAFTQRVRIGGRHTHAYIFSRSKWRIEEGQKRFVCDSRSVHRIQLLTHIYTPTMKSFIASNKKNTTEKKSFEKREYHWDNKHESRERRAPTTHTQGKKLYKCAVMTIKPESPIFYWQFHCC